MRDHAEAAGAADVRLAAVGTGTLDHARNFAAEQRITFPLLVDERLASYRAVGVGKAATADLVAPSTLTAGVKALARGRMQGRTGLHPMVLGAAHVILPDGSVAYAWVNADFADNAPVAELLQAATG